jgi:small-conductance mechanosensitive channel
MDLEHPFSEAFGPASTRDELIESAQNIYACLLKLAPGSRVLPASVLTALSENEDGPMDKAKKRSLSNLFRPDSNDDVPLLAFIQSCDTVYKKLRYFRASVGNDSVIDKVLEGIIDVVFGFVLALLILSLLQFNPWHLLVSMSTLMVTFAFAVGPSAAKAIEVSRPNKVAIHFQLYLMLLL